MILECGHEPSVGATVGTGYGQDADGKRYCYACCATRDREQMVRDGKATLYLSRDETGPAVGNMGPRYSYKVTNWPGSLVFKVGGAIRHGKHNIARTRSDVWFTGPDGKEWHGVQYGDNTQLCHCRRIKGGKS